MVAAWWPRGGRVSLAAVGQPRGPGGSPPFVWPRAAVPGDDGILSCLLSVSQEQRGRGALSRQVGKPPQGRVGGPEPGEPARSRGPSPTSALPPDGHAARASPTGVRGGDRPASGTPRPAQGCARPAPQPRGGRESACGRGERGHACSARGPPGGDTARGAPAPQPLGSPPRCPLLAVSFLQQRRGRWRPQSGAWGVLAASVSSSGSKAG